MMMIETSYVIRYYGLAGSAVSSEPIPDGAYLKFYDPEAFDGRGDATWTLHLEDALKFASPLEATELWRTQSKTLPIRPDGKPNRPLTAFTVAIERAEQE
jgi:hypothetical protein